MLADGAARQQDLEGLVHYAHRAEETAARHDHKLYLAISHRALGVLHRLSGDYAKAGARLNTALTLFQEMETRWQTGRTLAEFGRWALEQSDIDQARSYLTQALEFFKAMDAKPDADRVRMELAALK